MLLRASAASFAISFFPVYLPNFPGSNAASYLSIFLIALPTFLALFRYLGLRRGALSLLTLSAFAYVIETVGVVTSFPYGEFRYSDVLGPKVLGVVPYLLPMTYLPFVIGAVAASWGRWSTWGRVFNVLGAALLLTLIDGVLDPSAVALGFWDYEAGGFYYGVPAGNYLGWLLSGAIAAAIALAVGRWRKPPLPSLLDSAIIYAAFLTGVAVFAVLPVPALLGAGLFFYLIRRRSQLLGW